MIIADENPSPGRVSQSLRYNPPVPAPGSAPPRSSLNHYRRILRYVRPYRVVFACAIAGMLLVSILLLYWLYDRLVGIDRLKFG